MRKNFEKINTLESSIQYLMNTWKYLNLNPKFQREGGIWPRNKQQLFIDSILCGFDIPKFYFRSVGQFVKVGDEPRYIRYDVVDGKQRLLAIRDFFDGKYGIPSDSRVFRLRNSHAAYKASSYDRDYSASSYNREFFSGSEDEKPKAITYLELQQKCKDLYLQFNSYHLDIVSLEAVDDETVDEFFLRLNSGVVLNAQEKRNAINCPFGDKIMALAHDDDFMKKLRPRPRSKNAEILVKLFAIAQQEKMDKGIRDTKKRTLDRMYRTSEKSTDFALSPKKVEDIENIVQPILNIFNTVFECDDVLLRSLGNISVFFYAALKEQDLWEKNSSNLNKLLLYFEEKRSSIRTLNPDSLVNDEQDSYRLFETYNSYVQSTNDGSAIKKRAAYINTWIETDGNESQFVQRMKSLAATDDIDYNDPDADAKGPSDAI